MKSIYKSKKSEQAVLELYDRQLHKNGLVYKDIWVETSFGVTHIIKTSNQKETPLLLLHGGNATSAYNLLACNFLMQDFCIYAVDIIGHPGKSAQVSLSAKNYDYAKCHCRREKTYC